MVDEWARLRMWNWWAVSIKSASSIAAETTLARGRVESSPVAGELAVDRLAWPSVAQFDLKRLWTAPVLLVVRDEPKVLVSGVKTLSKTSRLLAPCRYCVCVLIIIFRLSNQRTTGRCC